METVYFDNSATTPLSQAAKDAMYEAMNSAWGNPSSRHTKGDEAHALLEKARQALLSALGARGAKAENLIFTASGTESDNLAILGTARAKQALSGGKAITTDAEHPAVLRAFAALEAEGYRVAYIPTRGGVLDMERFRWEMTGDTFLVSAMLINNETGAQNNIAALSAYAKSVNPDCIIHTDAVQGFMKVPFTPASLGADMITVSAHKIHGPKGVGALYVSPEAVKRRALSPVIFGGGQEWGMRSGTENMPGIAGFGAAASAALATREADIAHMTALRDRLVTSLSEDSRFSGCRVNLPASEGRAPHIVSLTLPRIKSETMLNFLSGMGICISSGSACSTHAGPGRVSPTLLAFGLPEQEADTTLRISLSAQNTEQEVSFFLDTLARGLKMLARMKR